MGDTRVKSSMVDLGLGSSNKSTLEDYLKTSETLPIGVFYKTSLSQAISDALAYLRAERQGSVYIPAQSADSEKPTQLVTSVNRAGELQINYITSNYRYPINSEKRPFTNDDWQVGDIIYNTDTTINRCIGWVCKEAGTPGTWGVVGFIRNWSTELEEVSQLPDPGPMQLNRQLVSNGRTYICKLVDGAYQWYWMDYAYGNSSQHPTTDLRVGMPYYNIQTGLPEWWNGTEWVAVAKANHSHEDVGASDTPIYGELDATNGIVYLPKAKEGFLSVDIKGKAGSMISALNIYSCANLIDLSNLVKVDDANSSFQVDGEVVTLVKSTDTTSEVIVAKTEISIPAESTLVYHQISQAVNSGIVVSIEIDGVESEVEVGTEFSYEGTDPTIAILRYKFPVNSQINSIVYLNSIYLIDKNSADLDFSLKDYLGDGTSLLGMASYGEDNLIANILSKKIVDLVLYQTTDSIELPNRETFLIDGFLVVIQNHKYTYLGRSMYLPENDDTASDLSIPGFTTRSYNEVKLGTVDELSFGISSDGMVAYSIPNSAVTIKTITYLLNYLADQLATEIKIPLKNPILSEFVKYPSPIRCHERGVLIFSPSTAVNTHIKYPINSAAVAEVTADILQKLANQRLTLNDAPLGWSSSTAWSDAATSNINWRGEKNG